MLRRLSFFTFINRVVMAAMAESVDPRSTSDCYWLASSWLQALLVLALPASQACGKKMRRQGCVS